MICELIVLGGLLLNPCEIKYAFDIGNGCRIVYNRYVYADIDVPCKQLKDSIRYEIPNRQ
jgi:hypothetical protein